MSLTDAELQQFHEEGYVVKPAVFSSADLQPIQDALGEIVDAEAKRLQSEEKLEDTYSNAPSESVWHVSRIPIPTPG